MGMAACSWCPARPSTGEAVPASQQDFAPAYARSPFLFASSELGWPEVWSPARRVALRLQSSRRTLEITVQMLKTGEVPVGARGLAT